MTAHSNRQIPARRMVAGVSALVMVASILVTLPSQRVVAVTNDLTLGVASARTEPLALDGAGVTQGDPITEYEYIINIDDSGTNEQDSPADGCSPEDVDYPDSCNWVSVAGVPSGSSPIYTQGDQDDFNGVIGSNLNLPDGDYLISVLAGGYKLGGQHFSVPLPDSGLVTVELQPSPLPAGTIQAAVFEDISPVNSAPDLPAEHGLAGFEAHIADYGGEVSTDIFGNPLGAEYDINGDYIAGSGGIVRSKCYVVDAGVDIGTVPPIGGDPLVGPCPTVTNGHAGFADGITVQGKVVIPNVGPNRYGLSLVAPDGSDWIQTTTLEGNHEWDAWVIEGSTGLDTEFVIAGEPFPTAIFGYVSPMNNLAGGAGSVTGVIDAVKVYVPPKGGTGLPGTIWANAQGMKTDGPIPNPWVTLSDLTQGDTAVYVGQGDANGAFDITGVPDGDYVITWWDEPQNYILDLLQITIDGGEVDMGVLPLTGWWTELEGYVFNDLNRNGVRDAGEQGVSGFPLTMRKRENSLMDRGAAALTTDQNGHYVMKNTYPTTQWLVMEAYNDLFYTTGITYQADNQPSPTTVLGGGVDVNVLPIIGLGGRMDWGVHAYDPIGVPTYDATVLQDSPSHYYRLGETVGSVAEDLGNGASNGTYGSAAAQGEVGLVANSGDAATGFDGASATSFVDTNVTSMSASAFSVEAWVNADSIDLTGRRIAAKDEVGVTGAWVLWFNQGKLRFQVRDAANANWRIAEAPTTPAVGTTFHVVGVFNGTHAILYVDGAEVARVALGSTTANTNALPITIGADSDPVNAREHVFDGRIDEVAIYDAALSATRIQAHYAAAGRAPAIDPQNGGIVGTVSYDTTRAELDARYAGAEDWQPSIPGLPVHLWSTIPCGTNPGTPCSTGPGLKYELDAADDGSYAKGALLNSVITEQWERPSADCVPRDVDGNPLVYPTDQAVTNSSGDCLEIPLMGVQFGPNATDVGTDDENFGAAVDGNYGFGDGCFGIGGFDVNTGTCANGTDPSPLPAGRDYLVEVKIPDDALGRPLYKVTREEDINVAEGDDFTAAAPPPACAGPLHTVDVADFGTDNFAANTTYIPGVTVPASTPTVNETFAETGESIYEGVVKPLCDTKLVQLNNGRSIAPTFFLFTDVPLPGRSYGLIVDDLNFEANPQKTLLGEKAGIPFAPIGIYDFNNKLVTTIESDFNGIFDVLLPSTNRINCATPAGVCANMFRFVGNDPGIPGRLNLNYKPQFRTISADFEVFAGLIVPADLAPTQVGVVVQLPNGQFNNVECALDTATPQLFAVDRPYVDRQGNAAERTFTIAGQGFGGTQGAGTVTLDGVELLVLSWSDTELTVRVRRANPNSVPSGALQLNVTAANGQSTINGLTFHVLRYSGGAAVRYDPNVYEVGPVTNPNYSAAKVTAGTWFVENVTSLPAGADHAIQSALDAAAASAGNDLVVVYPGVSTPGNPQLNPRGAYYENLILTEAVKLQGVGAGSPDGSVPGSIIDGGAFGGDSPVFQDWLARIAGLTWDGNQSVNDGAVVSIYTDDGDFTSAFEASIDGFDLRGGNQQGFPGNINQIGGLPTGLAPGLTTQGGAIFANGYARNLQITNNIVQNNGGAYGTIRIGTPDLPEPDKDNQNENVRIAHNRIIANGGTNLAGAIGLFAGADNYEVAQNDICGNFSAEYGGGLSVYGFSPDGQIHHNRIYYNASYDEGAGVMIAGELPAVPTDVSPGSGPVDIFNNLIQANLANDDGGGVRFLMAGDHEINVFNNTIVNNVSTHEGGGLSLNDAPDVQVYNNTVMKNLTTATAITSNGQPAPAGLSTSPNSAALQASLPGGSPTWSDPLLFNNVFWDNRAGTYAGSTVTGLGIAGDITPINNWDMGVAFSPLDLLTPTNSVLQITTGTAVDGSNSTADPLVVDPYDVSVAFNIWRNNPNFVGAVLVAVEAPADLLGNYHLQAASPAIDLGATNKAGVAAPLDDIDGDVRPIGTAFDSGSDETSGGTPPGSPGMNFSTAGNVQLPGLSGTADDADVYNWNDTAYSTIFDAAAPVALPGGADIDGLTVVGPDHFFVSFNSANTAVPGVSGNVQDEDIVEYNSGTWSMYFDGGAEGLTAGAQDLDAISVDDIGGVTYFSTLGNTNPTGVTGTADDADIYSWDGAAFVRVWDASAAGLPGNADVDGLVVVDVDHFYLSFNRGNTNVPTLGNVQDEDVVEYNGGVWSVYFDGTAHGLGTAGGLDIDAIDVSVIP